MAASIPLSSLTGTIITEEPPQVTRRASAPPSSPTGSDLEKQSYRRGRAPGLRRTSTGFSTTGSPQEDLRVRRDTLLSTGSSFTAPPLKREPTHVVEDEALHGYPKLASFVGGKDGYAIYRRFAFLNARNLLYHQAKLVRLEHELHDIEQAFAHEAHLHHKVDYIFKSEDGSPGFQLRQKYEEVSKALDKYNRLLLDQKKLHELPNADPSFVETIHDFIKNAKAGDPEWLQHPEDKVYAIYDDNREPLQRDLVTLNPEFRSQDPFTTFFQTTILEWWYQYFARHVRKPDGDLDEYVYGAKAISRTISTITMILASSLPTCSIVALFFIHSAIWRLVFIVLFSGVFASCLAFFTNAKRPEIFLASVSLASVQVVFVGTAFGGSGNGSCQG